MTREQVLELLKSAGNDLLIYEDKSKIDVTVEDFEGFDSNWCEIYRPLDNWDLVYSIKKQIKEAAVSVSKSGMCKVYCFDGFQVVWGCASFDI